MRRELLVSVYIGGGDGDYKHDDGGHDALLGIHDGMRGVAGAFRR